MFNKCDLSLKGNIDFIADGVKEGILESLLLDTVSVLAEYLYLLVKFDLPYCSVKYYIIGEDGVKKEYTDLISVIDFALSELVVDIEGQLRDISIEDPSECCKVLKGCGLKLGEMLPQYESSIIDLPRYKKIYYKNLVKIASTDFSN